MQLEAENAAKVLVQSARLLCVRELPRFILDSKRLVNGALTLMGDDTDVIDVCIRQQPVQELELREHPEKTTRPERIIAASFLRTGARKALFGPGASAVGRYVTRSSLYSASTYSQARALAELLRKRVFRKSPASIVDIGCNSGQNTRGFSDAGFAWIRAFDTNPVNVLVTRANMRAAGCIPSKTVLEVGLGTFPSHPFQEDLPYDDTLVFLDPEWGGPGFRFRGRPEDELDVHLGDMGFEEIIADIRGRGFEGRIVCKIPRGMSIPRKVGGTVFHQRDGQTTRVSYSYWTDAHRLRSVRHIAGSGFNYRVALNDVDQMWRDGLHSSKERDDH